MISKLAEEIQASATMALNAKAKQMKKEGKDVISFGIGQPDFPTPQNIKQAAIEALQEDRTGYTPAIGEMDLRQAIAEKFARENDLRFSPEQIAVGSGGKGILYQIFLTLLDPGDEVIVFNPYWVSYTEQIVMASGTPVLVGCDPETFALDIDDLQAKMTAKTKIIVLNSPNNPSGVMYSQEEFEQVLALAAQHDCIIISDECYEHFCFGGEHISPASFSHDAFQRTIVCNAVSKTYSMTGWRIGYCAIFDTAIIKAISRLQGNNQGNPCSISQYAAIEALRGDQSSVTSMHEAFAKRRDRMMDFINSIPQLDCAKPPGAFYCFPHFDLDMASVELCERILEEANVVLIPGSSFGMEGYVRFSYAVDDQVLETGMTRLKDWFSQMGK